MTTLPPMKKKSFVRNSGVLATYDWANFVEGLGYVAFYPFSSYTDTVRAYHLSSQALHSFDDNYALGAMGGSTAELIFTSPSVRVPRIIEGQVIISGYYAVSLGYASHTAVFTATLEKYSGSTATTIGDAYSQTFNTSSVSKTDFVFVFDATKTYLNVGDFLRLKISWAVTGNAGYQTDLVVYIDPTDATSRIQVNIPFRNIL